MRPDVGAIAAYRARIGAPSVALFSNITPEFGSTVGIAGRVLTALDESGAGQVQLILEVIPPFEQDDGTVIGELRESCDYWRAALAAHGHG